jgi:hypothetical protein
MRRLLVIGGIVAAPLGVAAVAYAATNTVTYTSKLSPSHPKPKSGKPANVGYEGILGVSNGANQPDTGARTVIYFPKQLKNNAKRFPSCTQRDIDGKSVVPSKCRRALVGSGVATSLAGIPGQPPGLTEQLKVTAYNGSKGRYLLLVLNTTPGQLVPIVNRVIPGKLGRAHGKFGFKVTFAVPSNLQNVGGLQVALTHFDIKTSRRKTVKVKSRGRTSKVSYIQLTSCPRNRKLPTRTDVSFDNRAGGPAMPGAGAPVTVTGTMRC